MQSIVAEKRDILGKKVQNLRKQGFLPAVVYGKGGPSESIAVKEIDFLKLWRSAGESTVVELKLPESTKNVLIQSVATDPLKDKPTHVDFYVVDMSKKIHVDVVLEFIGESEAVRSGGVLVKALHSLKVEALPKDLPHSISVDLTLLKNVSDSILVKDIKISPEVKLLDNLEETVVLIEAPRTEEENQATEAPSLESIEVVGKKAKEESEGSEEAEASKNE